MLSRDLEVDIGGAGKRAAARRTARRGRKEFDIPSGNYASSGRITA
jgi:hypothetical protein